MSDFIADFEKMNTGFEKIAQAMQGLLTENVKLKEFIDRFQTEYYLKNSATGMLELYSDIVKYEMAKIEKNNLEYKSI